LGQIEAYVLPNFPQLKIPPERIQFQNQFRGARLAISWCKPRSPCYLIFFLSKCQTANLAVGNLNASRFGLVLMFKGDLLTFLRCNVRSAILPDFRSPTKLG